MNFFRIPPSPTKKAFTVIWLFRESLCVRCEKAGPLPTPGFLWELLCPLPMKATNITFEWFILVYNIKHHSNQIQNDALSVTKQLSTPTNVVHNDFTGIALGHGGFSKSPSQDCAILQGLEKNHLLILDRHRVDFRFQRIKNSIWFGVSVCHIHHFYWLPHASNSHIQYGNNTVTNALQTNFTRGNHSQR